MTEADLYPAVKAFLEGQGYEVKGEVRGCDVVGLRGAEPPVVVEMKLRLNLALVLQGVERLALTPSVYLAVPRRSGRRRETIAPEDRDFHRLCRRIGVGLMTVDPKLPRKRQVEVLLDPEPYRPRPKRAETALLLREFQRRVGDPNRGGSTRVKIVTAYRQEALRCAQHLHVAGEMSLKALRATGHAPNCAAILQDDVYGWFERRARGVYGLAEGGRKALVTFAYALDPAAPLPDGAAPEAAD